MFAGVATCSMGGKNAVTNSCHVWLYLQRNVMFFYMGRKFFHFEVKLPDYLLSKSIKFNWLIVKAPCNILDFIEVDVTDFVTPICGKEEDKQQKMIFQALDDSKDIFVFMPPCQATTGLKMDILQEWGIQLQTVIALV